jgi:hypothetical protein
MRQAEIWLEENFMGSKAQDCSPNATNQPPAPGGDPDPAPKDLPTPRGEDKDKDKTQTGEGFGHIGRKSVPPSKGTPEPHEIF